MFKTIQAHSILFKGFCEKYFFLFYEPDSRYRRVSRRPKPFQGVPSLSKAFFRKKRLFIFYPRKLSRLLLLLVLFLVLEFFGIVY
jgi:hypothetical protein